MSNLVGTYSFSSFRMDDATHWDIYFESSEYGEDVEGSASDRTGEIAEPFCRASKQYDSPLLNGYQGQGWKVLVYSGEGGENSPSVLKVYKPIGAKKIIIHGYYYENEEEVDSSITIEYTRNKSVYASVVTTIALSTETSLPQLSEHISSTSNASISKFKEKSHELQINGSNFEVSRNDYLEPNKENIDSLRISAIPDYCNISMTRTFQKFFIGGYVKS